MRIAIVAVTLAMLLSTAAMAQTTTGTATIGGPVQSYWAAYNSAFTMIAPPGGTDDQTNIDVTAKVPYMAAEWLQGSSINFDLTSVAGGSALMSNVGLQNDATCNFPFYISLAPTPGCPNILNMSWDSANGYVTDGLGSQDMAVAWFYSLDGGISKAACTPNVPSVGSVKGPTFGSGARTFQWFVSVTPNANQRPGLYSLDPVVCINPDL